MHDGLMYVAWRMADVLSNTKTRLGVFYIARAARVPRGQSAGGGA